MKKACLKRSRISFPSTLIREALASDLQQLAEVPLAAKFLSDRFLVAVVSTPNDATERIAAYLAWRRIAPDECEILQLETFPPFRLAGQARRLVRRLKEQVRGDMFLEVRSSNLVARQLYESEGFTVVGVRRNYYYSPLEDGIVLKFRSC